ncbi:hypothetical protein [Sinomonas sp. ASV322]|uniref:hypothetical protein n=1 Tax=Sinomonas sp. ASV322 TaxID=3041920 RepID=UPI0027DC0146|nr:hypothetical protein [Sinomonas sp. ASV322]MDQ4503161.1 hypothetical protein [Sinomonas sp. ASV322]
MSVSAVAFQRWIGQVAPGASTADVCRLSGVKRSTLAQQLVRGKVAEATVVAVARAYGRNPVLGLAEFEPYHELAASIAPPTDAEVLSQTPTARLLAELLARVGGGPRHAAAAAGDEGSAVRQWVEAIDDGELRQRVSAAAGIAPQNYSAQLSANRLAPELAVRTAREAGVGLRNGLVVTGLVTAAEAGWPSTAVEDALERLSDAELAFLASERLATLARALKRQEHDDRAAQRAWDHLA